MGHRNRWFSVFKSMGGFSMANCERHNQMVSNWVFGRFPGSNLFSFGCREQATESEVAVSAYWTNSSGAGRSQCAMNTPEIWGDGLHSTCKNLGFCICENRMFEEQSYWMINRQNWEFKCAWLPIDRWDWDDWDPGTAEVRIKAAPFTQWYVFWIWKVLEDPQV
jgi:hypothetical protein